MAIGDIAVTIGESVSSLARSCKGKIVREKPYTEDDTSECSDHKSEKAVKKAPTVDPTFGCDAAIKTFYEGKNSNANYFDWVETPPKQVSKKIAKAYDRVAVKVYKVKDLEKPVVGGAFALKYHMIEVQSPILVGALRDIMKKEDVYLEPTETATFKHPFRPLWFRFDEIASLWRKTAESQLKSHLGVLMKVLNDIFGGVQTHLSNLQSSQLINFKYSWMYFPKDSLVYSPDKDCERICKVVDTEIITDQRTRKHLIIKAEELAFDGESFAWRDTILDVPAFEGNRPIRELDHFPLSFAEDPDEIKSRLAERGKKVLKYQGLTYCEYDGLGLFNEEATGTRNEKHNVSGRILIDIYGYEKHHEALKRSSGQDRDSKRRKNRTKPQPPQQQPVDLFNNTIPMTTTTVATNAVQIVDDKAEHHYIKRLSEADQKKNEEEMLGRPHDLMFLSPILKGYALKNKLWLSFYVDDIRSITWNDDAYDHLVYDEKQKDLVLSFVENHKRTNSGLEDVIMGKGQGLILLLSGPPGTGKTLTAEAVADRTRRPLYYLQAEDLGINAALLGANIKKVFEMATEWDAVILLDEADVFMAERNPNDIARNELVSIFLRELEYFRGIIFLTTNLYETIDTAFRSRVNIHLLFNPLPPSARQVLWRKFLERLPPMRCSERRPIDGLEEEDLKELAKWELNGREIKNAIKTVKSWCDVKGYEINLHRLESGIKVTAPQGKKTEAGSENSLYD
ncbi:uncharacterized protein PV09_07661 [Verruconis gallopava]|uniref:AAA+ ATPase domain-containing protein n=1 Tax=Verruconis gallopava TaxID=253628 RepID=A0A0D2A2D2_9PEZI|nr:uncharacterized protein PV09_07661 [Verruconis gallopava]KIW00918.1 hypothetical protein PV09_07661 [Verruconis gallopava]